MHKNPNVQWAISQGMWSMQGSSLADVARKMAQYNLDGGCRPDHLPNPGL